MSRSVWKVPYLNFIFFSNFFFKQQLFFIWWRNSSIPSVLLSNKVKVYNGVWMLSLVIKSIMIGFKFGEFSITKRLGKIIHEKDKKKN